MTGVLVYDYLVKEDIALGNGGVEVQNPGGGSTKGSRVNLQSFAKFSYSASWTPGSVLAASVAYLTIPIPGVVLGDFVMVSFSGIQDPQVLISGYASATDAVTVAINNTKSIAHNPGTGTVRVLVFRSDL